MKHNFTPFEGKDEAVAFADLIFANFFLETDLGCHISQLSLVPPDTQLEHRLSPTGANNLFIVYSSTSVGCSSCTYDVCTLFFDDSKT